MRWEQLTVPDFAKAVRKVDGFGIVPIGVLEPHATHLPLGQDMLAVHGAACRAAKCEPAIVFPPYPFGINHEAAHLPGAVILRRELVMELLQNVCDEMVLRNGLRKILLLNGHGGNRHMLGLFVQTSVQMKRNYLVYTMNMPVSPSLPGVLETTEVGHACERETSVALELFPELVKMNDAPPEPFANLKRSEPMKEHRIYGPMDWYGMYPTMHVGSPRKATPAKGKSLMATCDDRLVAAIKAIKADKMTPELMGEFMGATGDPVQAARGGAPGSAPRKPILKNKPAGGGRKTR